MFREALEFTERALLLALLHTTLVLRCKDWTPLVRCKVCNWEV